jgi:hypothetical protein
MRLLAFSDIHHNLAAVRKLRASETNSFDAIVVAGDIGSKSANDFFRIVTSFECPVLYVYGNWDRELDYGKSYGDICHLIHANVVKVEGIYFTGFSGCPTAWGKNPVARRIFREVAETNRAIVEACSETDKKLSKYARGGRVGQARNAPNKIKRTKAYQRYVAELRLAKGTILRENRDSVVKAVRGASVDPHKCVIVTHERLARLSEQLPGSLLHLYGHVHQYSDQIYRATRYVDVAAMDRPIPVRPRTKKQWTMEDCLNVNGGNYAVIEISSSQTVTARCVYMRRDYPDWLPVENPGFLGTDWISEEKKWTAPSDVSVHR